MVFILYLIFVRFNYFNGEKIKIMEWKKLANKEALKDKAVDDFVNALTGAYLKYKLSGFTKQELSLILEEAQTLLEEL